MFRLFICLSVSDGVMRSIDTAIEMGYSPVKVGLSHQRCMSVCLSVYLFLCLSVYSWVMRSIDSAIEMGYSPVKVGLSCRVCSSVCL